MSGKLSIKRLLFDVLATMALLGTMPGIGLAQKPLPQPTMERALIVTAPRIPRPARRIASPVSTRPETVPAKPGNPAPARPTASLGAYFAETITAYSISNRRLS